MGGLNLVDPWVVNRTCGAKIWWKWIKEPTLPWARHWKENYTPDCDTQDLIRLQEVPEGSSIWNHARNNRNLVQEHSFWEIRNGRDPIWRDSIILNPGNTEEDNESSQQFNERILKRKIRKTEEDDKLRWGLKGNGNFSLKEARNIIEREEQVEAVPWCSKVWDSLLWPKIRTFLWLLMRNKTLTWDNLCKKGFRGPSRCPMCLAEEESINHLFNACEWANQLWNWMEGILSSSDRDRESIHSTILNWKKDFSNIQRVNSIWKSILGFLLWSIWKERNCRIFQDEHRNIEFSKDNIINNIQQLI
eukprot:PITA_18398